MKYREINGAKYQIMETLIVELPFDFKIRTKIAFAELRFNKLYLEYGYVWDGPSGPTIDTKNALRGSAIHDSMSEMIKRGLLPMSDKPRVDYLLEWACTQDGMNKIRAAAWHEAVGSFFGTLWMKFSKVHDVQEC